MTDAAAVAATYFDAWQAATPRITTSTNKMRYSDRLTARFQARLQSGLGDQPSRVNGRAERGVVPLGLVGVRDGEVGYGPVEDIPLAEV